MQKDRCVPTGLRQTEHCGGKIAYQENKLNRFTVVLVVAALFARKGLLER